MQPPTPEIANETVDTIAMYVACKSANTIYTVIIRGHRQRQSSKVFYELNLDVPYKLLSNRKIPISVNVYDFAYNVTYSMRNVQFLSEFEKYEITDPIPLYDFYKMIGYDYTTKKFHSKTLRRVILDQLEEYTSTVL